MPAAFYAQREFVDWLCRMGWETTPLPRLERQMAEASLIESCLCELYACNRRRA
jgi:hypothetical protein